MEAVIIVEALKVVVTWVKPNSGFIKTSETSAALKADNEEKKCLT